MQPMITCILIDDEAHCLDWLKTLIAPTQLLDIKAVFTSPVEAMAYLTNNKIDLVFTDIQMPELSGIDLLKAFHHKTQFVVSSAFPQYAVEGFTYNVLDYLLKPIIISRFTATLSKIADFFKEDKDNELYESGFFFVKTEAKGKQVKVAFNSITLIENRANYVAIHMGKSCTLSLQNMKDIIKILPQKHFIRVHNSFIVPVKSVNQIIGNSLNIASVDFDVPIGITYKETVIKQLGLEKR
jgi:two-component system, LytTR family, response regulator